MILIIESGATKSDWLLLDEAGTRLGCASTAGMNFSTMTPSALGAVIAEAAAALGPCAAGVNEVFLYAAGIPDAQLRGALRDAFAASFPSLAVFEIQSDLVAAARAVCGHGRGVAAILGTGSNSCLYDGNDICGHINAGGFILGDEGGASRLGLKFLSDHIKGLVPAGIDDEFNSLFDGSYAGIVANVYGRGAAASPSGYLGSLAPFLLERYSNPYIKGLVDGNFEDFFDRCVVRYREICPDAGSESCPLGIAGGFGWACRDIVRDIAATRGVAVGRFVKSPVNALPEFHCRMRSEDN